VPWGIAGAALVSAGASAYGASKQAGAAKDAAGAQETAALQQVGLDTNVFNAQAAMQLPTRELGGEAQNRLAFLLGLDPNLNIAPDFATPNINPNPQGGAPGLTWNGPASGYGWDNTGSGNPNAPTMQPTTYNGVTPQFGVNSGGSQAPGAAPSGSTSNPWGVSLPGATGQGGFGSLTNLYDPNTFYQDPGYNFDVQQGQQGLNRAAAAGGQLGSGASLKAAINYATGMASNEFNNAFNRSATSKQFTFNELASLAGAGQTATNTVGSSAGQLGQSGSSALAGYGNAAAAGSIGVGNAWSGAATSIGNMAGSLGTTYFNSQNPSYNPYASAQTQQIINTPTPQLNYSLPTRYGGGFNGGVPVSD
jgi:hypothetical protein